MASNSTHDDSLTPPPPSTNSTLSLIILCLIYEPSGSILFAYNVNNILLLLPLSVFILRHGVQQWTRKSSTTSVISHTDLFAYHMMLMELVGVLGSIIMSIGFFIKEVTMLFSGVVLFGYTWFGQVSFHVLTCVERYLAVVHPIIYLRLRNQRGTRIRNVAISCVWLLGSIQIPVMIFDVISLFCLIILFLSLPVVSFCSISVLQVLLRPGPGEKSGNRENMDLSKQRAFYTILAILGALMFRFAGNISWSVMYILGRNGDCVTLMSEMWANVPSSLVLPLLFLIREGKLLQCKKTSQ